MGSFSSGLLLSHVQGVPYFSVHGGLVPPLMAKAEITTGGILRRYKVANPRIATVHHVARVEAEYWVLMAYFFRAFSFASSAFEPADLTLSAASNASSGVSGWSEMALFRRVLAGDDILSQGTTFTVEAQAGPKTS